MLNRRNFFKIAASFLAAATAAPSLKVVAAAAPAAPVAESGMVIDWATKTIRLTKPMSLLEMYREWEYQLEQGFEVDDNLIHRNTDELFDLDPDWDLENWELAHSGTLQHGIWLYMDPKDMDDVSKGN